jgi:hypothetical protein
MMVVAKVALVETCSRYAAAPLAPFQVNAGFVETFVVVLAGETSVGTEGGATMVVKLHTLDQSLVPPALAAFIRQ